MKYYKESKSFYNKLIRDMGFDIPLKTKAWIHFISCNDWDFDNAIKASFSWKYFSEILVQIYI